MADQGRRERRRSARDGNARGGGKERIEIGESDLASQ
jgi:hypothetical protein